MLDSDVDDENYYHPHAKEQIQITTDGKDIYSLWWVNAAFCVGKGQQ